MTSIPTDSRRWFIAGLGAASIGGLAHAADRPNNSGAAPSLVPAGQDLSSEYLLSPGLIHLNTASLGVTPRVVLDRTIAAWRELESSPVLMAYGNAENTVLSAVERVRKRAARFLGCEQDELLITRCTTDAMSIVAQGMRWTAGERVLTTDLEHDGGSLCWAYIARRHGVVVDRIPIALDEHESATIVRRFAAAITPATRVISVSHVISSTGLRMPIAEISALARERGILCVVDGAQAIGAISVNVKALGCHAYATSGHKWLMGPKGTGLLYVSREASEAIQPIQWQDARRYGAESAGVGPQPLVIGLGAAIERMQDIGMTAVERHDLALRNRAYEQLTQIRKLRILSSPPGPSATAIVACVLPDNIDSMTLRDALLAKYGIIVKMSEKRHFNGFRLSPHILNNEAHVDAALKALRAEVG
jgi:selenocysteine lyase/cysteine desulfurase